VDSDETGDSLDPYIIRRKTITATAGQTVFTTDVVFTDGYEQIYYNGVLLVRTTDYTTSGGTNTVTLLQGASAGDTVEIISSTPINLVNTLAGNSANTIIAQTASSIPLIVQGATSQTANLFEVKNSAGEIRHEFKANGQASVRATGPDQAGFAIERYTDDLAVLQLRSFGGTISSPTVKTNGTRIGMITAEGYDGTSSPSSARIQFFVDGTVSTGNVPGAIGFNTTPVGGSHTERMRITSAGNVYIGTTDASAYGGKLAIVNSGQSSMFMWNVGQGSGHIGFPASGSTMRIVNTYTDGLIANGVGIDITTSGNVGIGNTSPSYRLQVNSSSASVANDSLTVQNSGVNSAGHTTGLRFRYITAEPAAIRARLIDVGNGAGALAFYTSSDGSGANLTERMRIRPNGAVWIGSSYGGDDNWTLAVTDNAAAAGAFLSTTTLNIIAGHFESTNASYTSTILSSSAIRSNSSAFSLLLGRTNYFAGSDTEFNLRGDGQAYADGSWNAGGADYAEYFEWADGNPDNEDRRGYSVSLVGKKIKVAEEEETPIGVISGNPSIIGDAGWNSWNRKYLLDDFGSYIRDENGERILNPDFDEEMEYVSREDRPEWAIVGLMGKLRLRKNQVVGAGWIKMDDVSEQVEEWLVK
jgi:hypothetical protein